MPTPFTLLSRPAPLTDRQLDVLRCAAEGLSGRETARALGLSEQTVKNHLSRILLQLGVDDRTAAVVIALQQGWLDLRALRVTAGRQTRERVGGEAEARPALAA